MIVFAFSTVVTVTAMLDIIMIKGVKNAASKRCFYAEMNDLLRGGERVRSMAVSFRVVEVLLILSFILELPSMEEELLIEFYVFLIVLVAGCLATLRELKVLINSEIQRKRDEGAH